MSRLGWCSPVSSPAVSRRAVSSSARSSKGIRVLPEEGRLEVKLKRLPTSGNPWPGAVPVGVVAGVGLGLGADIFDRSHRVDLTHLGIWSRGYQTKDRKQAGAHHNGCLREVQRQLRLAHDARMAYCLGDSWKGAG